jgi:hypothetical protein
MSEMYTFLNQYKDRMNEVVAELEIVKKTNYDIQTVQWTVSSLCERGWSISKLGKA